MVMFVDGLYLCMVVFGLYCYKIGGIDRNERLVVRLWLDMIVVLVRELVGCGLVVCFC